MYFKRIPCLTNKSGSIRICILSISLFLAACSKYEPRAVESEKRTVAQNEVFERVIQQGHRISDPAGWIRDIQAALDKLKLPRNNENMCAIMATIEQESGFKEDPPVAGLARLLQKRIDKTENNLVLMAALEVRLSQPMSAGSAITFRSAIKNIKTERDLARWYEAFTAAKYTGLILDQFGKGVDELIATVGSMQVSVSYARDMASRLGLPSSNMRDTLYSRDGGVLYGSAHLLYYPAHYDNIIYRFADYNAGQYASRNAGFQTMVNQLASSKIRPDGDLLQHNKNKNITQNSQTQAAVIKLFAKLAKNIKPQTIDADLKQEKSIDFEDTTTYATVLQLMAAKGLKPIPAAIPKINLKSEKITRPLTTEWYANSVNGRYQRCLKIAQQSQ